MVRKVATSLATFELADETAPRRSCSSAARDHERLPVALLHGFTGNKQSFATLRSGLRARGFRVLAFDLPFHGGTVVTAPVAALSVEGCARALVEALDALGVQRFCLMGYSMGGRIAPARRRGARQVRRRERNRAVRGTMGGDGAVRFARRDARAQKTGAQTNPPFVPRAGARPMPAHARHRLPALPGRQATHA